VRNLKPLNRVTLLICDVTKAQDRRRLNFVNESMDLIIDDAGYDWPARSAPMLLSYRLVSILLQKRSYAGATRAFAMGGKNKTASYLISDAH